MHNDTYGTHDDARQPICACGKYLLQHAVLAIMCADHRVHRQAAHGVCDPIPKKG